MPEFKVTLVGHKDAESDGNRHGHDDEGPANPCRVVGSKPSQFRDDVERYRSG